MEKVKVSNNNPYTEVCWEGKGFYRPAVVRDSRGEYIRWDKTSSNVPDGRYLAHPHDAGR